LHNLEMNHIQFIKRFAVGSTQNLISNICMVLFVLVPERVLHAMSGVTLYALSMATL
jgi:hypothetical protein